MLATAIQVAAATGLGGMAGLLGGMFGVGGGFLVIPLLGFFYGMDQQTAQGTALIMVVPNVLWAFSRYQRRFGVDLRMAAAIAGSALIAAYPTARFTTGLDPYVLRLAFAVFLATTAGTVAYRTWRGGARVGRGRRLAWGWVTVVGIVGGVVSGFFGVGGAFIAPPLLTTFFGLRQLEAQGLALALVSPSALLALVAYAEADQVDRPSFNISGIRRADLVPLVAQCSSPTLTRHLARLRQLGVIKRVTGTYRYYLTRAGRAAIAAGRRLTEHTIIPALA